MGLPVNDPQRIGRFKGSETFVFCCLIFSICHETFVFCHETFLICHVTFVFCCVTFLICHETFIFCHETFLICHETFLICHETFVFCLATNVLCCVTFRFFHALFLCLNPIRVLVRKIITSRLSESSLHASSEPSRRTREGKKPPVLRTSGGFSFRN